MNKKTRQIFDEEDRCRSIRKKAKLGLYLTPAMPFSYNGYSNFVYTATRGVGKTVIALEVAIILKKKYGSENVKVYYFRTNDNSIKALLSPDKAVDPYLMNKYDMNITVSKNCVYNHGELLYEAYPLVSAAGIGKGVNFYDCNWFDLEKMGYYKSKKNRHFSITIWDEFLLDENVGRKSCGDPVKLYRIYREAIFRDAEYLPYDAVYNFLLANNVSECANVTGLLFNYIPLPNNHKIVKLTRRHTIFWNVPITLEYLSKRKKSINADIMDYKNDPNYADVARDMTLIKPKKVPIQRVTNIIKFSNEARDWFTVYDDKYIRQYRGESTSKDKVISMKRHIDNLFFMDLVTAVFEKYDVRYFMYCDIQSMATFLARMKDLKSR